MWTTDPDGRARHWLPDTDFDREKKQAVCGVATTGEAVGRLAAGCDECESWIEKWGQVGKNTRWSGAYLEWRRITRHGVQCTYPPNPNNPEAYRED